MNNLIKNKILYFSEQTNGNSLKISLVTQREFSKTSFEKTTLNYLTYLDTLTVDEVNHMLNLLCLSEN